jgi:hypothetical protein
VNAICKQNNARLKVVTARALKAATPAQVAPYLTREVQLNKAAAAKFAAVQPPSNLESDYIQWLSGIERGIAGYERQIAALKAGDIAKTRALQAAVRARTKISAARAAKMGLTECYQ